jgi:P-type conjugative transfer protein TrbL
MILIGNQAVPHGAASPSRILDVALSISQKLLSNFSLWPSDFGPTLVTCIAAFGILIIFALIAANFAIEYCAAWVLLYVGCIFLGFGATSWTSDMALNYFRAVLGSAVRLLSMLLIVGVGVSIINISAAAMDASPTVPQSMTFLVTGIILYSIMNKVPALLSNMVGGGSGVSSLGLGTIMGAAGIAAGIGMGAAAAGGAATNSSVANAILNAYRGAQSEGNSTPPASFGSSQAGGGQPASTPLANAMGIDNKNAVPADPKGASGSYSGGVGGGKGALDYMAQGTRELGSDLEKGGGA